MAKRMEWKKAIAQYAGYVDNVVHIGDNDYGRSGDWIDVAVYGGIIRVEAIRDVSVDDQVLIRGYLRNRGRVIDFVTTDVIVCNTDDLIQAWENSIDPVYHAMLTLDLSFYDRVSITNKAVPRFSARFRGVGIQFSVSLEQEQYLNIKQFNGQTLEWAFDLVRDFRVTGSEGNRNTIDTWALKNPRPLMKRQANSKNSPSADVSSAK